MVAPVKSCVGFLTSYNPPMTPFAQLEKNASPKWAKMLSDKLISSGGKSKLQGLIPSGTTRQVGSKSLGEGMEAKVFPSFTGGVGDTATKVFLPPVPRYANETDGLIRAAQRTPHGIQARADAMRANPGIFPTVYGNSSRSISMERLEPLARKDVDSFYEVADTLRGAPFELDDANSAIAKIKRSTDSAQPWWRKALNQTPDYGTPMSDAVGKKSDLLRRIAGARKDYYKSPLRSITDHVSKGLGPRGGAYGGAPRVSSTVQDVKLPGGDLAYDFLLMRGNDPHNIMRRTNGGRAVISDAMLRSLVPRT